MPYVPVDTLHVPVPVVRSSRAEFVYHVGTSIGGGGRKEEECKKEEESHIIIYSVHEQTLVQRGRGKRTDDELFLQSPTY